MLTISTCNRYKILHLLIRNYDLLTTTGICHILQIRDFTLNFL